MIPSSDTYGVPGAGDEMIFADIVRSLGCDADHVSDVLADMDAISGGCFADLDRPHRDAIVTRLHERGGIALAYLSRIILQCYYRDDRVMRSLGMEVRPPFPLGFAVEQGDWSLLDPVRARPKMYRDAP